MYPCSLFIDTDGCNTVAHIPADPASFYGDDSIVNQLHVVVATVHAFEYCEYRTTSSCKFYDDDVKSTTFKLFMLRLCGRSVARSNRVKR